MMCAFACQHSSHVNPIGVNILPYSFKIKLKEYLVKHF